MSFRFIHTGDWHIGRPFGRFEDGQAGRLRFARLDAVDRIAAVAQEGGCQHVLVAGDVYDSPGLSDRDLRQLTERLRRHHELVWHLLPGNHDPVRDGGIWARLGVLGVPENVRLHVEAAETEIAEGVMLLAAPCHSHRMTGDPTAWMDGSTSDAGAIRIGLAHGPAHGFGGESDPSGVIAPGRRQSARLDYLALGDWHGMKELATGVWYAGTPEPDQFSENDPGHVLRVSIPRAGATPEVERIATAQFRWYRRSYMCMSAGDIEKLKDDLRAIDAEPSHCLVRVAVEGEISVDDEARLRAVLEEIAPAFFHIRERLGGLRVRLDTVGDEGGGLAAPHLAAIVARLKAEAETSPGRADVVRDALRLLVRYDLNAEQGGRIG